MAGRDENEVRENEINELCEALDNIIDRINETELLKYEVGEVIDKLMRENNFPYIHYNGYYFNDESTYPHKELHKSNPKTVELLRTWLLESYLKNSEVDSHECDENELHEVNKCITLIIGDRLHEFVNIMVRSTKSEGDTSWIGKLTSLFSSDIKTNDNKINAKEIITEVFGKLIFGFNDTNPKDLGCTYNGLSGNNTPYMIMTKICRDQNSPIRKMNTILWIGSHINLSEVTPSSYDNLVSMLAPSLIEDGLIKYSDVGMIVTKSANKK